MSYGLDGSDIVKENLRQLCVWNVSADAHTPEKWWRYVNAANAHCGNFQVCLQLVICFILFNLTCICLFVEYCTYDTTTTTATTASVLLRPTPASACARSCQTQSAASTWRWSTG
jgi:hypothetical protein